MIRLLHWRAGKNAILKQISKFSVVKPPKSPNIEVSNHSSTKSNFQERWNFNVVINHRALGSLKNSFFAKISRIYLYEGNECTCLLISGCLLFPGGLSVAAWVLQTKHSNLMSLFAIMLIPKDLPKLVAWVLQTNHSNLTSLFA